MDYILVKLALCLVTMISPVCISMIHKLWVSVHIKAKAYESDQYFYNRACSIAFDFNFSFSIFLYLAFLKHEDMILSLFKVDSYLGDTALFFEILFVCFLKFYSEFAFNYINKDYFWVRNKLNISEPLNSKKAYMPHYSLLDLVSWKRFNKKWNF
jgi:hypothetical protein